MKIGRTKQIRSVERPNRTVFSRRTEGLDIRAARQILRRGEVRKELKLSPFEGQVTHQWRGQSIRAEDLALLEKE